MLRTVWSGTVALDQRLLVQPVEGGHLVVQLLWGVTLPWLPESPIIFRVGRRWPNRNLQG
jgi:hypothetical protein